MMTSSKVQQVEQRCKQQLVLHMYTVRQITTGDCQEAVKQQLSVNIT